MSKDLESLIKEINILAKKRKSEGLTPEEELRRKALHAKYIEIFRAGFRQELDNIRVIDKHGNDVTPKRKKIN